MARRSTATLCLTLGVAVCLDSPAAHGHALLTAKPEASAQVLVVAAKTIDHRGRLRTRVCLRVLGRSRLPRQLVLTVPGGRDRKRSLLMSAWPLLHRGQRLAASFRRGRAGGWTLLAAREVSAHSAWTRLGDSTVPPSRLPLHWHVQDGLASNFTDPIVRGVSWWSADPGSFVVDAFDGGGPTYDISQCGTGSWIAFRDLDPGIAGLGGYCADSQGTTEIHVLLDSTVNYDLDSVASHEWGHGLGFGHSEFGGQIMTTPAHQQDSLGGDDINAVRALYPGAMAMDLSAAGASSGTAVVRIGVGGSGELALAGRPVGTGGCQSGTYMARFADLAQARYFTGAGVDQSNGRITLDPASSSDGSCAASLIVRVAPGDAGPGQVRLLPSSTQGDLVGKSLLVEVKPNRTPTLSIRASPSSATAGETVTFSAVSNDPDGDQVTVAWDLDADGSFNDASGSSAARAFPAGTYTVRARATDSMEASTTTELQLIVHEPAPTATDSPATTPGGGSAPAGSSSGSSTPYQEPPGAYDPPTSRNGSSVCSGLRQRYSRLYAIWSRVDHWLRDEYRRLMRQYRSGQFGASYNRDLVRYRRRQRRQPGRVRRLDRITSRISRQC